MSTLASLVASDGTLKLGVTPGDDVKALQLALSQAGYRVDITGTFTQDTDYWVRRFQTQQGLLVDGAVGPKTAALLDAPHADLIAIATPTVVPITVTPGTGVIIPESPHDDTASLIAFYGKPWEDGSLLVEVPTPFPMTYTDETATVTVKNIRFHKRAAPMLVAALAQIAKAAENDVSVLKHVTHFSGSYNFRPIRGSSRLSCHAFGAAIDFDAERLPFTYNVTPPSEMPTVVVDAFKGNGFFWGADYHGRRDPMHWQFAHE